MTIILRQGIERTYPCANYWDAEVLFNALTKLGCIVEMWEGATLLQRYNPY